MAALATMMAMTANAQTRVGEMGEWGGILPGELTSNGVTLIQEGSLNDYYEFGNTDSIKYYNSSITTVASFAIPENPCEMYFMDYDILVLEEARYLFSQTLFNNDADWEYLKWYGTADTIWYEWGGYHIDTRVNRLAVMKYNGEELFSIYATEGWNLERYAIAIKWGGEYFLAVTEYQDTDEDYYGWRRVFYRIDRSSQKITRVEGNLPISAFPSVADRSQTITVELGEGTNASEVQVINTLGQVVKTVPVQAGQRKVQLRASDLNSGMHILGTRTREGKGACKIIVK